MSLSRRSSFVRPFSNSRAAATTIARPSASFVEPASSSSCPGTPYLEATESSTRVVAGSAPLVPKEIARRLVHAHVQGVLGRDRRAVGTVERVAGAVRGTVRGLEGRRLDLEPDAGERDRLCEGLAEAGKDIGSLEVADGLLCIARRESSEP